MAAKLTMKQVREIRQLRLEGVPVKHIANAYGVSESIVRRYTQAEALKLRA